MDNIFSIGHGVKNIELFLRELKSFEIYILVDVRSIPYSRRNPVFNTKTLETELAKQGIKYDYWGNVLGGFPKDVSCYDANGKVDYEILKTKEFFRKAIENLVIVGKFGNNIALMCSESNPAQCHRAKLIGMELLPYNIIVRHIVGEGKEKDQKQVMLELTAGKGTANLFGHTGLRSRK
ncbi:MAG: DUF488 domain-containing protein [Prevotellaceae bacterium]|jgi:uncharacterized protein (DUF488 family)|nr:DUF488 domain-containing protein [Prevotellaceae bacterium]